MLRVPLFEQERVVVRLVARRKGGARCQHARRGNPNYSEKGASARGDDVTSQLFVRDINNVS